MARAGVPAAVVDAIVHRSTHGTEGTELLPTVEHLLGRPPHTFAHWAARHLSAFQTSAPH